MNIIPRPRNITEGHTLNRDMLKINNISSTHNIYTNLEGFLLDYLTMQFSLNVIRTEGISFPFIQISDNLRFKPEELPSVLHNQEEGYLLRVNEQAVIIAAHRESGLFYGIQTYLQLREQSFNKEIEIIDWPDNAIRGFHLETRFGIPRFERILEIIDEICKYKFNTILMELEDKFPYEEVKGITAANALSKEQLQEIIKYAGDRYIEIIPLQQTLGHVEYILKHEDYYHRREVRGKAVGNELPFSFNPIGKLSFNDIDEFCPANEEAYEIIEKLCREMAETYPSSRYIHVGCDEAWNLINCELCKEKYGQDGYNKVFLEHTNRVAEYVTALNKTPVIWDDMLRGFSKEDFQLLNKNIVIMCWLYYDGDLDKGLSLLKKYHEAGFKVIGASSAKCCEGMSSDYLDMPDMKDRLTNINDWSNLSAEFNMLGVVTTVWSNYTGTIAPPHPFFDTIWYPLIYSAEKYWNTASECLDFDKRFMENFFGVEGAEECFGHEIELLYEKATIIADNCKRNKYVAEVYKIISLLSIYRQKSMATYREMYKLYNGSTEKEKAIVVRKIEELKTMREYLKPEVTSLVGRYFGEADTKEFVDSRFFMDDVVNMEATKNPN